MGTPRRRALKARCLFPVAQAPVRDGVVTIEDERIVAVGHAAVGTDVEDLGNVAILPGFVNAHTHLEFSSLVAPLGTAGQSFPDWIRAVLDWRRHGPAPGPDAVRRGVDECSALGTTTLGDIAQPDWPRSRFEQAPLHATVFQELIGPTVERAALTLKQAEAHLEYAGSEDCLAAIAPHAPYTVSIGLLEAAVSLAEDRRVPLAFHLAESREELQLLRNGDGPLHEFLCELGTWDAETVARGARPLDYLRVLAGAPRTLVIHGNYLADDEIAWLAEHRETMSVVYCPRTHAYFRHQDYPLSRMLAAGVRVCLGTDSRATSPDLSLLAEMREVARRHPGVDAAEVLAMGTFESARALGRDGDVGSLEPGKFADLAVVALPSTGPDNDHLLLLNSDGPVVATWFRGRRLTG